MIKHYFKCVPKTHPIIVRKWNKRPKGRGLAHYLQVGVAETARGRKPIFKAIVNLHDRQLLWRNRYEWP